MSWEYTDDPTAELFELAGAALVDPGNTEPRLEFWMFVDRHGDHEGVAVLKRSAAASHPPGLAAGDASYR